MSISHNLESTATDDKYNDLFRAHNWTEYIGQDKLKAEVGVAVKAAKMEGRPMRPTLFVGSSGMGKTTLAGIIAAELEMPLRAVVCPFEPIQVLRLVREPGVLFFDEIHNTSRKNQDLLLPLVDEPPLFQFGRKKIALHGISVIAATTEGQKLVGPLVQRFMIAPAFDPYTDEQMTRIVAGMVIRTSVQFSEEDCLTLGQAAAGVPRVAKSLIMAASDLLTTTGSQPTVKAVLDLKRIRQDGLGVHHCRYLWLLYQQDGKAGQALMASALDMNPAMIVQLERRLINKGLLMLTPRGRELSADGWEWVSNNPPEAM